MAYAATTHGCGSQPDGVWAMELGSDKKDVVAFQPKDAMIAGSAGPALGRDGTVYITTTAGDVANVEPADRARVEDAQAEGLGDAWRPRTSTRRRSSLRTKTKTIVAVTGTGKLYLFDSTALAGGADRDRCGCGHREVRIWSAGELGRCAKRALDCGPVVSRHRHIQGERRQRQARASARVDLARHRFATAAGSSSTACCSPHRRHARPCLPSSTPSMRRTARSCGAA